jgi:hypothetical protein
LKQFTPVPAKGATLAFKTAARGLTAWRFAPTV